MILASSSPRRRALLDQIGVSYSTVAVDIDESRQAGEAAEVYVERLALAKARAGRSASPEVIPVLGADTVISIDGDLLSKPNDRDDALAMLGRLSGRTHYVLTGVALAAGDEMTRISKTAVTLREIAPQERAAYWRTGEPADKAGAYAIQGRGAVFVARLEGSYSGVVGLPLYETAELLQAVGLGPFGRP